MPAGAKFGEQSNCGNATAIVISDVMLFREGIVAGLRRLHKLDILGGFCPQQGLAWLATNSADLVILDTSRRRALPHASAIKQLSPKSQIIAFGIGSDDDALSGAEAGIAAFVGEGGSIEDVNEAALGALSGQSTCSPELTARLLAHIADLARERAAQPMALLTAREEQIAGLVARGDSNKQIAIELRISPATVKNHVHHILEKLELKRRSAIGAIRVQASAAQL
jgi:two-component system, NarL family, nitrate/nitrite response regulator NarL